MELSKKYTVIKDTDARDYLSIAEREILEILLDKISDRKAEAGKKGNKYFVLNLDTVDMELNLPIRVEHGKDQNMKWRMNACELVDAISMTSLEFGENTWQEDLNKLQRGK